MKPIRGYNDAQASGGYTRLPAGGYIIKITGVEDVTDKQYLTIFFDIAEGPERGRFKDVDLKDNKANWRCSFIRSYKETALGMLKAFIQAVDASEETNFNDFIEKGFDEQLLKGNKLGVVIGYEEYVNDRGETKERMNVVRCCPVSDIREGKFTVPELKKLPTADPTSPVSGFTSIPDGDLPF